MNYYLITISLFNKNTGALLYAGSLVSDYEQHATFLRIKAIAAKQWASILRFCDVAKWVKNSQAAIYNDNFGQFYKHALLYNESVCYHIYKDCSILILMH